MNKITAMMVISPVKGDNNKITGYQITSLEATVINSKNVSHKSISEGLMGKYCPQAACLGCLEMSYDGQEYTR